MREIMPQVLIENLTFPPEDIETIEYHQNDEIKIHLSDRTLEKKSQYEKWRNICGTLDQKMVEQVSIGKNHYTGKKFMFTCDISIGIPGKQAENIFITVKIQPEIGF